MQGPRWRGLVPRYYGIRSQESYNSATSITMETLSFRVLRNDPGKFEEILLRQKAVVLNKNGEPFALVLDLAAESLESAIRIASQVRAQLALSELRETARKRGLDRLTPAQIEAEITAVRA